MSNIDFQRYRQEGESYWNWGTPADDARGENNFETLSDAVTAYFASVNETVTMEIGVAFPAGYSGLQKISDDLFRITLADAEPPADPPEE